MKRYSFKPEATVEDMRLGVALLIEENPSGAWVKHEEADTIINDLIKQIADMDGEHEQTLKALAVAHDTIAEKQGRIEELEARGALTPEQKEYMDASVCALLLVEPVIARHKAFFDKLPDALQEMVRAFDKVRKFLPSEAEKEGAA